MEIITKYKAEDNSEFLTQEECLNYENSIVDIHGIKIHPGDWIKESWCFHGFGSPGMKMPGQVEVEEGQYKNLNKSFRFVQYSLAMRLGLHRVSSLGWPVSDYEVEIVSPEYVTSFVDNKKFFFQKDGFSKNGLGHYRLRQSWDKE